MVAQQSMTQAITEAALEAAKVATMVVKEVKNSVNTARSVQVMPRTGKPALIQPTFDWKEAEKHQELQSYKMEVKTFS